MYFLPSDRAFFHFFLIDENIRVWIFDTFFGIINVIVFWKLSNVINKIVGPTKTIDFLNIYFKLQANPSIEIWEIMYTVLKNTISGKTRLQFWVLPKKRNSTHGSDTIFDRHMTLVYIRGTLLDTHPSDAALFYSLFKRRIFDNATVNKSSRKRLERERQRHRWSLATAALFQPLKFYSSHFTSDARTYARIINPTAQTA